MKVGYEIDSDGKYVCNECGWKGSRSGFYKHRAVHASPPKEEELILVEKEESQEESQEVEVNSTEDSSWMDWGQEDSQEAATEFMPSPLKALQQKAVKSKRSKKTKAEIESARNTSKSLMTLALTFTDSVLSVWGRGVLIDPDFKVQHSDKDKEITADAVIGAMEEKGLFLSDSISRTTVATVMVGWYIGAPAYRIQKKAKRGLFKGGRGSGLLSRIPLLGRLFRKKKKKTGLSIDEVEAITND